MDGGTELRCFCTRRPLLGVVGVDRATGEPYVWIRVYKQGRVFGEIVVTSGELRLRCRECLHWHVVTLRREKVRFEATELPKSIALAK